MKIFNLVYKIKKAKTEKSNAVDHLKMANILIKKGFSNLYIAADMWIHCTPITLNVLNRHSCLGLTLSSPLYTWQTRTYFKVIYCQIVTLFVVKRIKRCVKFNHNPKKEGRKGLFGMQTSKSCNFQQETQ